MAEADEGIRPWTGLRQAINDYWVHVGAVGSVTAAYIDDRFPSGFLKNFAEQFKKTAPDWTIASDPQLMIPTKVMIPLFHREKERLRKRDLKERNRLEAAIRAAQVITPEMIEANRAAMAESLEEAECRRRKLAAQKATEDKLAKNLRKLKLSANKADKKKEFEAKPSLDRNLYGRSRFK